MFAHTQIHFYNDCMKTSWAIHCSPVFADFGHILNETYNMSF